MAIAIWKHKALVKRAMPFFSTTETKNFDQYAAFYETDLVEKPEEDLTDKIFR